MRILQIGDTDLVGSRFNGRDLHRGLLSMGVASEHGVWTKRSDDPRTWQITTFRYRSLVNDGLCGALERRLSIQSLMYPFAWKLPFDPRFRAADLVHYHLIHRNFFSLAALPLLTRGRPSVWTLHDPWAMTGHCLHPYGCGRWETGCGLCPDLATAMPLGKDRTAFLWKTKRCLYGASTLDVVVASRWMLAMARRSPLLSGFRIHHIPFGIDLDLFRPGDAEEAKRRLGVFPGSLVVGFRATNSEYKGFPVIRECLRRWDPGRPVCLLTFHDRGLVDEFRGRYQIVDMGWVEDEGLLATAYNAADLFLMPSAAEAFGMMAVEAMACGKPVIAFDGTALPETLFAPRGGVAVPQGDAEALLAALDGLARDPARRRALGGSARELAERHYDLRTHVGRMLGLYREIIARREARG